MKKSIALFIPALPYGGAERVVQRLSYILRDKYNLYVILFDNSISKYKCGCEVIDMAIPANSSYINKSISIVKRVTKLNRIVKDYNIEVVISFLDGASIINLLSTRNNKKIISIRNYKNSEKHLSLISRISDYLISKLYRRADAIVPVSKLIRESLIVDYNISPEKINVIYNPYSIDEISNLASVKLETAYSDFYDNSKVIITVGRKTHQKGFWHLVKAFNLVKQNVPEAKLVIIGDGEQDAQIKKLIKELNIIESVMLTGHQENPFNFISKSDLYVMSSLFEGFPNSLVEAMACSKPVVCADCKSGPREILYRNSNIDLVATEIEYADFGVLVPPLSEKENWNANEIDAGEIILSQAIIKILGDRECLNLYSKKAIKRAEEFDYENCKKSFIELIEQ